MITRITIRVGFQPDPPLYHQPPGRLAQLVERLPYKQEVACSSQAPPTEEMPANEAL
jgi:hypothetical protein